MMEPAKKEWKDRFWANGDVGDLRKPSKGKVQFSRFAIWIDLDVGSLSEMFIPKAGESAFTEIGREIGKHGFILQRAGIYIGDQTVDAVKCVIATQSLALKFPWFEHCVQDIRMFRIEEISDLSPAIELAAKAERMALNNG